MNHLLVTIVYSLPGTNPCITSAVVPIENHMSFATKREEIMNTYRLKKYYEVTINEF